MNIKNKLERHVECLELSALTSKAYLENFEFKESVIKQTERDIF